MALRITPTQCTLLVIDLQERLLPVIEGKDEVLDKASKLMCCAKLLDIPTVVTEQLPDRLGKTSPLIAKHYSGQAYEKSAFGAANDPALLRLLEPRREVVILGTETHVCVLQTALQLLEKDYVVWVVSDACGSRTLNNKSAGLARLQQAGATPVTTEMVVFEWLEHAHHPKFREALALIK